jgi:flagellum-specific peptidoglycan hydrolase FlgJ
MKVHLLIFAILLFNTLAFKVAIMSTMSTKDNEQPTLAQDDQSNKKDESSSDKEQMIDNENDETKKDANDTEEHDWDSDSHELRKLMGDVMAERLESVVLDQEKETIAAMLADKIQKIRAANIDGKLDEKELEDRIEKAKSEFMAERPDQDIDFVKELMESILKDDPSKDWTDDELKGYIKDMLKSNERHDN